MVQQPGYEEAHRGKTARSEIRSGKVRSDTRMHALSAAVRLALVVPEAVMGDAAIAVGFFFSFGGLR